MVEITNNINKVLGEATESGTESSVTLPSDITSGPVEVTSVLSKNCIVSPSKFLNNETIKNEHLGNTSNSDHLGLKNVVDIKSNNPKINFISKETIEIDSDINFSVRHMTYTKTKLTADETFKCEVISLFLLLLSAVVESFAYKIRYKSTVAFGFGILFLAFDGMCFINMIMSDKVGRPPFISFAIIWGYLAFFCLVPNNQFYDINKPYLYPWISLSVVPYFFSGFLWSFSGLLDREKMTKKAVNITMWALSLILLVGLLIGLYFVVQNVILPKINEGIVLTNEVKRLQNTIGILIVCIVSVINVILSILHNKRIFKSAHIIIYFSICIQALPFALVAGIPLIFVEFIVMCCSGCCGSGIARNKCCKSIFKIFKKCGLFDAKKKAQIG